jgi:MoaA/NifB/PqqE/SkfB family radical SAM enzyme
MVRIARDLGISKIAISTNGAARPELYRELVAEGVDNFSISADCRDLELAAKLSGRPGTWNRVKENIRMLSGLCYVNTGTTITAENLDQIPDTLQFLGDLGVADIKLSTATQFQGAIPLTLLDKIPQALFDRMPILRYRIEHYRQGRPVRGLVEGRDSHHCWWVQDDIVLTPDGHYPCIVYPREKGRPIGPLKTVAEMRAARLTWALSRDTFEDPICSPYCMDIFAECNKRIEDLQGLIPVQALRRNKARSLSIL